MARHLGIVGHGDRLDGVDGRDGIGTGEEGRHRRMIDMGDVGRHLRDDGYLHRFPDDVGVDGHQFRVLTHIAAHARQSHLRAREVKFDGITACLLGPQGQFAPLFLGLSHDTGDDHLRGIVLFEPTQDVEVQVNGILTQLLHIAETIEVAVHTVAMDGIETRRHLFDLLEADGLIEHASPPCLKGTRHHLIIGTHRRRGQKERILTRNTTEIDGQAGIVGGDIIGMYAAQHLLQTDGPIVADTGFLGRFQVGVATVGHPSQSRLVVVKTDGTNGSRGIAGLTCYRTRCLLAHEATASLFIDVDFFHKSFVFGGL